MAIFTLGLLRLLPQVSFITLVMLRKYLWMEIIMYVIGFKHAACGVVDGVVSIKYKFKIYYV